MVSLVKGLVIMLFGVQNVKSVFIIIVQMCLGSSAYFLVKISVCRACLGHKCLVKEKEEFKRGGDILEEVEKFVFLVTYLVLTVEHLKKSVQEYEAPGRSLGS